MDLWYSEEQIGCADQMIEEWRGEIGHFDEQFMRYELLHESLKNIVQECVESEDGESVYSDESMQSPIHDCVTPISVVFSGCVDESVNNFGSDLWSDNSDSEDEEIIDPVGFFNTVGGLLHEFGALQPSQTISNDDICQPDSEEQIANDLYGPTTSTTELVCNPVKVEMAEINSLLTNEIHSLIIPTQA